MSFLRVVRTTLVGFEQGGLALALLVVCVVFGALSPYFLLPQNGLNIASASAYLGISAAVATLLLVGGGLDLSITAVMAFVSVLVAQLLLRGVPWYLAIPFCLLAGAAVGAVNGVIVTYVRINPLIVTIGSQFVVRGLAFIVAGGQELPVKSSQVLFFGQGHVFGMPFSGLLMLAVFVLIGWLMHFTPFGKHIYAIGGSPQGSMARLSGINVERHRMQMYVLSGTFAALSGLVLAGYTGTGLAYSATGMELTVIAAVILGGTALSGGRGNVLGTLIGVALLGVIANGMVLLSIPSYWQYIFQGLALLLAVIIDEVRLGQASR